MLVFKIRNNLVTDMNIFEATMICMKKYTNFSDRASRQEHWLFSLAMVLLSIIAGIVDSTLLGIPFFDLDFFTPISSIYFITTLIPSVAVSVRRLHDVNKSGWWTLIVITGIGLIPLIYWACKKSDETENHYGILTKNT